MTSSFVSCRLLAASLAVAAVAAAPTSARADRRAYGETYEAVTAPKGELDVELWNTYARAGEVDGGPASRGGREMVELEYGLSDRWDVALYNMVDETSGDTASGYAGFKVESRYRPTFRGQWFVDPVFYLEFAQRFRGDASQSLEAKLILAKDLARWNVALNLGYEEERLTDGSFNPEGEYAFGTSYEFSPAFKVGAEVFGKEEPADRGGLESYAWAGPAVSYAVGPHGILRGVWATIAGGAGLTSPSDAFYGRLIVGLQF